MVTDLRSDGKSDGRGGSPTVAHRIPVIDKMVGILELIQEDPLGLTLNDIVAKSGVPRSTVYRIINTLATHGIVSRRGDGRHVLGMKLASLASSVSTTILRENLIESGHDLLLELAQETGETCKLSVLNGLRAEVIDVAQSPNEMAPMSRVGSSFHLHAGAASKLLLAFSPTSLLDQVMAENPPAYTVCTITDRRALESELSTIRETGISVDRGEWHLSVHALAVPVFGHQGAVVAAISATHFALPTDQGMDRVVTRALQQTAKSLSRKLGYFDRPTATRESTAKSGKSKTRAIRGKAA